MNYHLHHQGQALGVFSLEELRRQRESGELTEAAYVWREGMPDWQPLDSVLASAIPAVTPPPLPKKKTNKALVWGLVAGGTLLLVGLTLASLVASKFLRRVRSAQQQIASFSGVAASRK